MIGVPQSWTYGVFHDTPCSCILISDFRDMVLAAVNQPFFNTFSFSRHWTPLRIVCFIADMKHSCTIILMCKQFCDTHWRCRPTWSWNSIICHINGFSHQVQEFNSININRWQHLSDLTFENSREMQPCWISRREDSTWETESQELWGISLNSLSMIQIHDWWQNRAFPI